MKKKLLSILLCLCLVLSALPAAALAQEPPVYLALGDSISTGCALNDGEQSFVDILTADNGFTLVNQAVDGNTASGIQAQLADNALDSHIASAHLITITCGGNDMMDVLYTRTAEEYNAKNDPDINPDDVPAILSDSDDSRWMTLLLCGKTVLEGDRKSGIPAFADSEEFQTTLDAFIANLTAIVTYVRQINPDAIIIITTQYNPYKDFTGLYQTIATNIGAGAKKLSDAIMANAEAAGYLVADVYTVFENSSEKLCNPTTSPINLDFHPNAAGHAVIAQIIQGVLDSIVPEEPNPTEPEPTEPEPTEPEPMEPEPTEPEPTEPEPTECPSAAFTDVSEKAWYHEAVDYAVANKLMQGVSATKFAPDLSTNRAMIATILWRQAGTPNAGGGKSVTFPDVADNQWFTEAVEWCAANGIVTGYANGNFGPGDNITREQLAAMLQRYAKAQGQDTSAGADDVLKQFRDAGSISSYAVEPLGGAVSRGIMNGKGNGILDPRGLATRAEAAQMLMNFLKH